MTFRTGYFPKWGPYDGERWAFVELVTGRRVRRVEFVARRRRPVRFVSWPSR